MPESKYISYRIEVPKEFEQLITHFYFAQNNSDEAITKKLVPTFQTILVFSFGNLSKLLSNEQTEIDVGKCLVLGPVKKAFTYTIPPSGQIFVVSFKDDAFYRLFSEAISFQNFISNPDKIVVKSCFEYLWQELANLDKLQDRVEALLNFCKPYIKGRSNIAEQLANFNDEAKSSIKANAATTNQSERTIQKEHKKLLGFTSKEKNRYQRFLKTIKYLQENPQLTDWFEVINEFGYYDQSQLIHDFQFYIGTSPKQYLKFQQDICSGNV